MFLGGIKEKHWPEMGQEKNLGQIVSATLQSLHKSYEGQRRISHRPFGKVVNG